MHLGKAANFSKRFHTKEYNPYWRNQYYPEIEVKRTVFDVLEVTVNKTPYLQGRLYRTSRDICQSPTGQSGIYSVPVSVFFDDFPTPQLALAHLAAAWSWSDK
jgi:hypothetical protein